MLNRLVELSLRYKFLVLIIFAVVAFLGISAVRNVPGIAGATELGANRTVLLLDVGRLVDEGVRQADSAISIGMGTHVR